MSQLRDQTFPLCANNLELQLQLDSDEEIRFRQRLDDGRSIWIASGLSDRALQETMGLRDIPACFAASGPCWHSRPDCQGLSNANRVTDRDPCHFCLVDMPPYIIHQDTGNTFLQACQDLFDSLGGRIEYMDSIIHDVPNTFQHFDSPEIHGGCFQLLFSRVDCVPRIQVFPCHTCH